MEMKVEIQGTSEALYESYGSGFSLGFFDTGFFAQIPKDALVRDLKALGHELRLYGKQQSQLKRKAQHPLPDRFDGKYLVNKMDRALGHAPSAARGAKAALLATERDQVFFVAIFASGPQKPVGQNPALKILVELLLNELRQWVAQFLVNLG
jgi:hypothetical protein